MSADVLSPSKSRSTPNPSKAALTHLVGRPLVPFFDGDAEQTPPNYDPNDFAVPEHLKLASRKFVNGYWVNEDGSTAQIGENTPTLINATNAHNNNNGVESQKSPQRTSSQPIHKSVNTPVNGQRAKHSKKQHSHHHAHNASNAHTNNSDADVHSAGPAVLGPPAPAPSRSASDTKVQFSQSNKSNKHNKSIPSLSASTPSSLSYAAIVAKSSNSPSHVQQDLSSSNSGNEVETFQTPFKSKKQFNGTNSSNNGIHKIPAIVTNGTVNGNKTDKENFAALSSPAPNNIPMPKFLSSSSPPSFNSGNPSKSPSGAAALASAVNDLTSLTLNSPVATTNTTTSTIADSSASASVASLTSTNSSSSTLVENAEKGAQLLSLLKKGLSMNTDSNNSISAGLNLHTTTSSFAANGTAPTFPPNVYPSHYSYTYPYPAHNSAAPYPYAAAGYHPSYASAMGLSHHTHYPMQPSTAASLSAATSLPVAAAAPPSLMLLTNDGRAGGENSVKSVPINGSTTSPTLQSQPHHPHPNPNPSVQNHPYSFPMTHVHPYSSAAFHPPGHTHSLSSMNFSHAHGPPPASVYTHFSPPHAIPFNTLNSTSSALAASAVPFASSSVSSSSTSALVGQQYPAHGSPLAAPSH